MIPGIETLYQQIADSMLKALPESWSNASITAVFFAGSVQYSGEYVVDGQTKSFATELDAERALRSMRDRFKEANQPLWCRVVFELRPNGTFDVKWGYDDCDDDGWARFDPTADPEVL